MKYEVEIINGTLYITKNGIKKNIGDGFDDAKNKQGISIFMTWIDAEIMGMFISADDDEVPYIDYSF